MRNIIYVLILIAIGVAAWWTLTEIEKNIVAEQEKLSIERTANIVEDVRQLAQFTTACFYQESVVRQTKQAEWSNGITGDALRAILGKNNTATTDELVLITRGSVRAGFNMAQITDDNIKVLSDTIIIKLPQPEVFDVIINPSDYDVFIENGTWTHEQLAEIVTNAQNQMRSEAIANGIYKQARESGEAKLQQLFHILGFNTVIVE